MVNEQTTYVLGEISDMLGVSIESYRLTHWEYCQGPKWWENACGSIGVRLHCWGGRDKIIGFTVHARTHEHKVGAACDPTNVVERVRRSIRLLERLQEEFPPTPYRLVARAAEDLRVRVGLDA